MLILGDTDVNFMRYWHKFHKIGTKNRGCLKSYDLFFTPKIYKKLTYKQSKWKIIHVGIYLQRMVWSHERFIHTEQTRSNWALGQIFGWEQVPA